MSLHLCLPPMRWRVIGAIAALSLAILAFALPASAATDEPSGEPGVRWSLKPSNAAEPDGRLSIEHALDPGQDVTDYIAVRNLSSVDVTFSLTAADGFFTSTGRFDILAGEQESVAAGTWISIPASVTVPAEETVVVPFTVDVPERAGPGDHAAGITASVRSVQSAQDGTAVGVDTRIGVKVLTRVTGDIAPAATVALDGQYTMSWNPFTPGRMTVDFEVVNDGNTRLLARGTVRAGGRNVVFPAVDEIDQELFPGDARVLTATVDDVWPTLLVPTAVTLDAEVLAVDGETSRMRAVTAEVMVWAPPVPQLLLILGFLLLVGAALWGRVRAGRRVSALIADAREAGRRDAEREK